MVNVHLFAKWGICIQMEPYLWVLGDWTGNRWGIGGGPLDAIPAFGGRGGILLLQGEWMGETGEDFLPPSTVRYWAFGWMANVWGLFAVEGRSGGWDGGWGGVNVELGDTDRHCKAGALTSRLSSLGEPEVWTGGKVKGCGGQFGVLRGGTGGKEVSKAGGGLGSKLSGVVERNLVLSFGTGFFLSLSIPPSLSFSPSFLGTICLFPGTGFSPSPLLSCILDTCLSLGTGVSRFLGVGLKVSPSCFTLSWRRDFSHGGTGNGLSPPRNSACPISSDLSNGPMVWASWFPCVLFRLAKMRLWWPGRVIPMHSSCSGVRLRHCCNVAYPALWNASEYCSRRSTPSHSPTLAQDSDWDIADVFVCAARESPRRKCRP